MQNPQQMVGVSKENIASSRAQSASFDRVIQSRAELSQNQPEEPIIGDAASLADLRKLQDPAKFEKARFQLRLYKRL